MKIILQGGGSYPESKEMDQKFFTSISNNKILYIPIAMVGHITFDQCKEYLESIIEDLGLNVKVDMITDFGTLNIEAIFDYGGVYIGGGNTFKLLYEIKKNNIFEYLAEYLMKGGTICGGSAGAIIFGNNINTSNNSNITGLKDMSGYNYLNNASIWCHYENKHKEQILEYIYHYKNAIIALSENSGLFVENKTIECIGNKAVFYGINGEILEYNPGDKIIF